jgi:predicted nucleic acid-binding protein
MFLLDTCLISELVKKEPNPRVTQWLDEQAEQTLFLSILTLGELQKGISKLADGDRKEQLQGWVDLDRQTALVWGRVLGEAEQRGEKLPVMDSLIAATAIAHGFVVVTRNVRDMERCRAKVFNPWDPV